MKTQLKFILGISICMVLLSCEKFVDIDPSAQLISNSEVFSSDQTALSAVDGVYVQLRAGNPYFANGGIGIYTGLAGDEIVNTATNTLYDPFANNNILATTSTINSMFWTVPYNTIYRTNVIMEGLEASDLVSTKAKKQLLGEMLVVRSLIYFYLINLYGDIPLIVNTDYRENMIKSRTPAKDVYSRITSDLLKAKDLLSDAYPSTGKIRPNRFTASALLARIYLCQRDWVNAERFATEVISSNKYSLKSDLSQVFLINSSETIWEIAPQNNARNSAEASVFVPASQTVRPAFTIRDGLLSAFTTADKRKTLWISGNTVSGIKYSYPSKYKNTSTTNITEYNVVLRLAEQYLIRAEAMAMQGKDQVLVLSDLEQTRSRAGLNPLSNLSTDALNQSIANERRLEFFCEWGTRWIDLKRSGNINTVMSASKPSWKSNSSVFPIPQDQLNFNNNLIQNQGY